MNEQTDPSVPDDRLLAISALLDGTADAGETALVESSIEAQALLAEFRSHQRMLRSVAVPADAAAWSISAALDIFDRDQVSAQASPDAAAAAASAPDRTVVRLHRRQRGQRVLTGMAAALVVVLAGFAVVGGLDGFGGSDEDLSLPSETPLAAQADVTASNDVSTRELPAAAADSALVETVTADTTAPPDSGGVDASGGVGATAAPPATEAPAAVSTFSIDAGGATAVPALSTPPDLVGYAAGRSALVPLDGQTFRCVEGNAEALGAVTYGGVEAIVTRDRTTERLAVYDLRDCRVLASATP